MQHTAIIMSCYISMQGWVNEIKVRGTNSHKIITVCVTCPVPIVYIYIVLSPCVCGEGQVKIDRFL